MKVTHLVPGFPPTVNGVGDYALLLALRLRREFAVESAFIVADPAWPGSSPVADFEVTRLRATNGSDLGLRSGAAHGWLIVHYVPHGYAARGVPRWLFAALRHWHGRILAVFHETYASGPPSSSQFWLSPLQRYLGARLVRLSSACLTSTEVQGAVIKRWGADPSRFRVAPVPSNVGEPDRVLPLAERAPRLMLFGGQRERIYRHHMYALEQLVAGLGLCEVVDVGPPVAGRPSCVGGLQIRATGPLPGADIQSLLGQSRIGVMDYPNVYLGKSGVFAAFCAHGLATFNLRPDSRAADGLRPDLNLLCAGGQAPTVPRLQDVADAARSWYSSRGTRFLAHCVRELLDVDPA